MKLGRLRRAGAEIIPVSLMGHTAPDGCGLDAATGYTFPRTAWGDLLKTYLETPW